MARGWHYTKLSLSSALLLSFSGMCILFIVPFFLSFFSCFLLCFSLLSLELSVVLSCDEGGLKRNQNAPGPSEHPPVRGKNVKTFRWDHRLQIQNLFMAFKRVPRW